MEKVEST